MPRVPAGSGNVLPFAPKPPEEVYIAMAAAEMNKQGRLFEPEQMTEERVRGDLDKSKSGDIRMDPNEPANKKFFDKIPEDMEVIDNTDDTGRGKGESVKLRYKKAPTS